MSEPDDVQTLSANRAVDNAGRESARPLAFFLQRPTTPVRQLSTGVWGSAERAVYGALL
jgi:hypothetical protein